MYALARDLMKKPVVTHPDALLADIAGTMETLRISSLPVVDNDGSLKGVISKTDLVHFFLSRDGGWGEYRAEEAMNPAVISCHPATPLPEVGRLMNENRVHHILVLERETLVGVISALDLAEPMLKVFELLKNAQSR